MKVKIWVVSYDESADCDKTLGHVTEPVIMDTVDVAEFTIFIMDKLNEGCSVTVAPVDK